MTILIFEQIQQGEMKSGRRRRVGLRMLYILLHILKRLASSLDVVISLMIFVASARRITVKLTLRVMIAVLKMRQVLSLSRSRQAVHQILKRIRLANEPGNP